MILALQIWVLAACVGLAGFHSNSAVAMTAFIFGGMVLGSIINAPGLTQQ